MTIHTEISPSETVGCDTRETKKPRIALVTGAAAGIGFATTKLLVRNGYVVVMADRDAAALAAAAAELPAAASMTIAIDVAEHGAAAEIDEAIRKRFEPVSILVNNAGISPKHSGKPAAVLEVSLDEWEMVLKVNLTAPLILCKQFLPAMIERGWGRIINMSSLVGRTRALTNGAAYATSKSGILGLTRHMAAVYARFGVTSNAVAPGRVRTALSEAGPQAESNYAQLAPVGRIGRPEEVAAAIAFLASEDAGFINGAVIDVNGGIAML